jgi:hypothetical protein
MIITFQVRGRPLGSIFHLYTKAVARMKLRDNHYIDDDDVASNWEKWRHRGRDHSDGSPESNMLPAALV